MKTRHENKVKLMGSLNTSGRCRPLWLLTATLLLLAVGCSDDRGDKLELLSGEISEGAEHERLRRLQLVRGKLHVENSTDCEAADWEVHFQPGGQLEGGSLENLTIVPEETGTECTVDADIEGEASWWHQKVMRPQCGQQGDLQGDNCAKSLERTCIIQGLRDAASVRTTDIPVPLLPIVVLPPQATSARVALLEEARKVARDLAASSAVAIRAVIANPNMTCSEGVTSNEQLTSAYVEAYHLYDTITDELVEATLAVADAQRSWSSSVQQGVSWSVSGAELSRAAAAHALVGGMPGLRPPEGLPDGPDPLTNPDFGTTESGGLCSTPPLSPQAQKALSLIRQAAPAPSVVLAIPPGTGTVSIENLIAGSGGPTGAVPTGSLRERLGFQIGYPEFNDTICLADPNIDCITGATAVAAHFGLEVSAFVEARQYLVEEIRAFARSPIAILNPSTQCTSQNAAWLCQTACTNGSCMPKPAGFRYAATASKPQPIDPVFWSTVASYGPLLTQMTVTQRLTLATNLGEFVDAAITTAQELVAEVQASGIVNKNVIVNSLSLLLDEGLQRRPARVAYSSAGTIANTDSILVGGFGPTDGVIVVMGEDGLRCAVEKSVEGMDCPQLIFIPTNAAPPATFTGYGREGFSKGVAFQLTDASITHERWYVVKAKDPSKPLPGTFEVIAGGYFEKEQAGWRISYAVRDARERAAEVLRPSPGACTNSAVECGGLATFDARMPLENELSDDGDAIESSWRQYLAMARQAADEADLLGQEYVSLALQADLRDEELSIREEDKRLRVEQELEELQDICGTEMDTSTLLGLLGGFELAQMPASTATALQTMHVCGFGPCSYTSWLLEQNKNRDAGILRLWECVAEGAVVPLVTLGDQHLCFEVNQATGALCPNGPSEDCPRPLTSSTCPSGQVQTNQKLGYFVINPEQGEAPAISETKRLCRAVRKLSQGQDPTELALVTGSTFFNPGNMAQLAERIGWEARFGGYSAVTLDGAPLFSTGDFWQTLNINNGGPGWPCNPNSAEQTQRCNGLTGAGLFCAAGTCDQAGRAVWNDRLMRAVIALRATALPNEPDALKGVRLPVYVFDILGAEQELEREFISRTRRPHPQDSAVILDELQFSSGTFVEDPERASERLDGKGVERRLTVYDVISQFGDRTAWRTPNGQIWHLDELLNGESGSFGLIDAAVLPSQSIMDDAADASVGWFDGLFRGSHSAGQRDAFRSAFSTWGFYRELLAGTQSAVPADVPDIGLPLFSEEDTGDRTFIFFPVFAPFLSQFNYSSQSLRDGLELACEAAIPGAGTCSVQSFPVISVDNLQGVEAYIRCSAAELIRRGAMTVLRDMPSRAIDALREESVSGSFNSVGGQLGVAVGELRTDIAALSSLSGTVSTQLGLLADDLEIVQAELRRTEIAAEISRLRGQIETVAAEAACLAATTSAMSSVLNGNPYMAGANALLGAANAVTQCASASEQATLAQDIADLGEEDAQSAAEAVVATFRSQVRTHANTLAGLRTELITAIERIDTKLAAVDGLRRQARNTINRALFMNSFEAERQQEISAAMAARREIAKVRYERAWKNAVLMTFLAKRAIEQRLGVRLADMRDNLPLVEAPATWEAEICTASGLDYAKLSDPDGSPVESFADAFIGDYVTRLENFIESYRLTNDFREGTDTAVVSLKEDVQNVAGECEVETGNLLLHSSNVGHTLGSAGGSGGWYFENCRTHSVTGALLPDCIGVVSLEDVVVPSKEEWGAARGYQVLFGPNGSNCTGDTCGFSNRVAAGDMGTSALTQAVSLPAGKFVISWYEHATTTAAPPAPLVLRDDGSSVTVSAPVFVAGGTPPANTWNRFFSTFENDVAQTLRIRIIQGTAAPHLASRKIAAFMLEDVTEVPTTETIIPHEYVATAETTTRELPVCDDPDGKAFRENWERHCVRLCSDGFSTNCGEASGVTHCYWETSFHISQWAVERGDMFVNSGFARGNFNYRLGDIGVNFVGTATRDCSNSDSPSTCYAAGFIPYSLRHEPPYFVRNHLGADFEVKLFTGNIEHARGLATERYLTNPLSDTDSSLVEQYMRTELAGRPLDGNFVLRVWEEPGVDFEAIKDVQLVFRYRYWTRFD